ncbi:c-type cytochrome domain-containing protein [Roseibacillus persicicus]|uniref:c-type cytochrome domain-containing protein n=1 Tax=Roseibacillus persicicus TaxID=454148 RepID=UPI00398AA5DB
MKNLFRISLLLAFPLGAQEKITYEDHIYPIFEQSCLNCHNPDKKKGDLDLSSYPALMTGGSGGKVVVPGDGGSSKLYTVTTGTEEPVMPPEGSKINKKDADLIRAWIDGGVLETKDSSAKKADKPKFDLAIDTSAGKPEGPPPMPEDVSLDPAFVAPQAGLVKAMAASPWAPLLAITGQKQILLYHSETFRFLGSLPFPKGQPESLTFHPSGKYLLASGGIAGKSGYAIAWDITTGKELFTAGREFDSVLAAALTPDLSTVAMGGPSRLLKIWNTRENQQSHSIKKHTDWITAVAASPDGKFFASGDRNGGIHVWDLAGNEIHALRDHQAGVTALAFRSDSKLLASTGEDGQLLIWDMKKGSAAKKINAHPGGATALFYHRDGHIVTAGRDRVVKVFKPDFGEKIAFRNLPELVTAAALSEDGKHVFTADYNGAVFAYEISSNKAPIATLESNPPTLESRLAYLRKQISQQSQKVEQAKKAFTTAENARNQLAQRIKGTKDALKKNEDSLAKLKRDVQSQEKKLQQVSKKLSEAQIPLENVRKEKKSLEEAQATLQQKIEGLKKENKDLAEITEQQQELSQKIKSLCQKESKETKRFQELETQRNELNNSLKDLRRQYQEIGGLVKAGKESLAPLEKQLPELAKKVEAPKKALEQLTQEEMKIREDLAYWEAAR